MLNAEQVDIVLRRIAQLERAEIIRQMRGCPSPFPIDFSNEWLEARSDDELRHVFAAFCQQADYVPPPPRAEMCGRG